MSLSSSIFQKPCPGCASSVSISAARCDCGHIFESASNSLSPLEASLRDEELYEGYLAARAEQAQQVAYAAEEALADDADNPELASAAALAREVAKSIDDDLAEQRIKIAAIQNTLRKNKPVAPAPVAAPVIPESIVVAEKPAPARTVVTPSTRGRPAPAAVVAPPISAPIPNPPSAVANLVKPASTPTWHATTAQKAAGVLAALKNAKVRETVARAKKAVVTAATGEKAAAPRAPLPQPTPASTSAPSAAPPSAFKKEQASKAEKIMEAHKSVDAKECPNCTSNVPTNTTRCQCGFVFVSGETELPSLTLCTGDFTALRNSLKLNLR